MEDTRMRRVVTMLDGHELSCLVPDTTPEPMAAPGGEIGTEISRHDAERASRLREWRDRVARLNAIQREPPPPRVVAPLDTRGGCAEGLALLVFLVSVGAAIGAALMGGLN